MSLSFATTPEAMVRDVPGLPVTPDVLPKLQRLLADANSDLDDIASLVRLEQVIAAQIVRLSNSPVYGIGRKISSIEEAFQRIGFHDAEKVVGLAIVAGILCVPLPTYRLAAQVLWTRSVTTALACQRLSEFVGLEPRILYSMGLMSQVGHLVIDRFSARRPVTFPWESFPLEYRKAEETVYSLNSYTVAACLVKKWGFVDAISEPIAAQHTLARVSPVHRKSAQVLYLARYFRDILETPEDPNRVFDPTVATALGISSYDLDALPDGIRMDLERVRRMMI